MATLQKAHETVVAGIVRTKEQLQIPEGMTLLQAKKLIEARIVYEDQTTSIRRTYNVFPWDGAYALMKVLERKYGWAQSVPTPGFFGDSPPAMIAIATGVDTVTNVAWGNMALPGIKGYINTGVEKDMGRVLFRLVAEVQRKHEKEIEEVFELVKQELEERSLYRGKAITMRFTDDDGDTLSMPTLSFIDVRGIDRNTAIYNEDIHRALDISLWTPIERATDCIANDIPLKRGILLGGKYGTGKTLTMAVAAALATKEGITYVHVQRADELAEAIRFARQYESPAAVVACEDIDRSTDGERDVEMDDLLNTIDGIDAKNSNIMVILTTNQIDNINAAMLRPGRLDAIIDIKPPDAPTVERLIRRYLGNALPDNEDIAPAGQALAGEIPAVIAEVCKRAKLAQLSQQPKGLPVRHLNGMAVIDAANTMTVQLEVLERATAKPVPPTDLDVAMEATMRKALNGRTIQRSRNA
jgi:transitional endoplasmic reticulum ATPase